MISPVTLTMEGISKSFGSVHALKSVAFHATSGRVHGLIGANGAGKSTLMKILSGIIRPDAGRVCINSTAKDFWSPAGAQKEGISIVPQEMYLIPDMSVEENILLGALPSRFRLFVNPPQMRKTAERLMDEVGLDVAPTVKVASLRYLDKVRVEVARLLSRGSRICIFDEVSSTLTPPEVRELYRIIHNLKARGSSVIYITHRLEELFQICDDIAVLRGGENAGVFSVDELDIDKAGDVMVGKIERKTQSRSGPVEHDRKVVMSVKGFSSKRLFQKIGFDLHQGEILVLCGVVGSGIVELTLALFGAIPSDEGEVRLDGRLTKIRTPAQAIEHGILFLPQNRQDALVYDMTVKENISLSILDRLKVLWSIVDGRREVQTVREWVGNLSIVTASVDDRVLSLSGGNQQKVVLSRLLAAKPKILILQDPTRGVDVRAKQELREILYRLKQEGISMIIATSEIPDALKLQDRILIMHDGRLIRELSGDEATELEIERALITAI